MIRSVKINWVGGMRAFYFGEVRLEAQDHRGAAKEVSRLLGGQQIRAVFNFR